MPNPTPEEIRQRCLEVQSTWTEQERWSRLRADWRPTFTTADGQRKQIKPEDYERHHEERANIIEQQREAGRNGSGRITQQVRSIEPMNTAVFSQCLLQLEGVEDPNLQKKIEAHNAHVSKLIADYENVEKKAANLQNQTGVDFVELETKGFEYRSRLHTIRQSLLTAAIDRAGLLASLSANFDSLVADVEARHEKVRSRIGAGLRKLGYSPEDQPHYASNPVVEETKFNSLINASMEVRKSRPAVDDAATAVERYGRLRRDANALIEELKQIVQRSTSDVVRTR